MVKLSGILEYSMGGFLCLRGFASYKMLSAISQPNPAVQRDLIEEHKGEMATFLNRGEYRFFPEVILSMNLTDGRSDYDLLEAMHLELQAGKLGINTLTVSPLAYRKMLRKMNSMPILHYPKLRGLILHILDLEKQNTK